MNRQLVTVLVCICTLALPAAALAQHEDHGVMSPDQIGSASVNFQTSCAPAVKDDLYLVPVKVAVRKAEGLELGDVAEVRLDVAL